MEHDSEKPTKEKSIQAVVFLCTSKYSYVAKQEIPVNGGKWTALSSRGQMPDEISIWSMAIHADSEDQENSVTI